VQIAAWFYTTLTTSTVGRDGTEPDQTDVSPLRGIKDSHPYFHDGRLLTLEDRFESSPDPQIQLDAE